MSEDYDHVYYLVDKDGKLNLNFHISPEAKEDFKKLMNWSEGTWKYNTVLRYV